MSELNGEIVNRLAEAEAERDAARYRWLRHGLLVTDIPDVAERCAVTIAADPANEEVYCVEVDAAIDEAMRATVSASATAD